MTDILAPSNQVKQGHGGVMCSLWAALKTGTQGAWGGREWTERRMDGFLLACDA